VRFGNCDVFYVLDSNLEVQKVVKVSVKRDFREKKT